MELLKIDKKHIGDEEVNSVSAKELYEKLDLHKAHYSRWCQKNILKNPFAIENIDFIGFTLMVNGNETKDYWLKIDFAKKLSMQCNSKVGESVRDYFIECEEVLKKSYSLPDFSNPAEAARAWAVEYERKQVLELQIKENKPLVEFAKTIEGSNDKISIGKFAKTSGKIGRNNLFKLLRSKGVFMSDNMPYQKHIDQGHFEVIERVVKSPKKDILTFTTYLTGKGQLWLNRKIDQWTESVKRN